MRLEDLLSEPYKPAQSKKMEMLLAPEPLQTIPEPVGIPNYLINDPEVVGYPDEHMQKSIYDWVISQLPIGGYSIKDFGAGRGDFFAHLNKNGVRYTGFEVKNSLVLTGRTKYSDIELLNEDFFKSELMTDYTVCIGTLNDNHGFDKWEYFNKTLKHCFYTTKIAIIFVLARNIDGNELFLDYPIEELITQLPYKCRFEIDYTLFEDIYKLTVHIDSYN